MWSDVCMAMFGRRRDETPQPLPDDTFPYLTTAQASWFRGLVRQGFAEAGLEVTVHADHVVDAQGREFGLSNAAALCHNDDRGETAWPTIVREHARRVVGAVDAPSPFDTMSAAELLASTYVRLMPAADIAPLELSYPPMFCDGVVAVLNVDLPESVTIYDDEHVEKFGPFDDLYRAGIANLRAVAFDDHHVVEHEGGRIDVLLGSSMFVASTILVLPDVVARYGGGIVEEYGVFVAAPFRHQLVFHVIRDASALASLNVLAGFALAGYADSVGPLSPEVFWWRRGEFRKLTEHDEDGISIQVDPDLAAMFEALADTAVEAPVASAAETLPAPSQAPAEAVAAVRALPEVGDEVDNPTEAQLFAMLRDLAVGRGTYLVVERTADTSGDTYAQVLRLDDGSFVVEHRAGDPRKHWGTEVADVHAAHALIAGWAFERPRWDAKQKWKKVKL